MEREIYVMGTTLRIAAAAPSCGSNGNRDFDAALVIAQFHVKRRQGPANCGGSIGGTTGIEERQADLDDAQPLHQWFSKAF